MEKILESISKIPDGSIPMSGLNRDCGYRIQNTEFRSQTKNLFHFMSPKLNPFFFWILTSYPELVDGLTPEFLFSIIEMASNLIFSLFAVDKIPLNLL